MVEESYQIESHGLDREARYKIIKNWIGKIEPMKTRSRESSIAAIVLFWITLYLLGFLIALIIPIVWIIWDIVKKPTPVEILEEDAPNFIKFKTGFIKNSYPTTVNVSNGDQISINYNVLGGQLFSGKIKERWGFLTNDLENIIKSTSGIESVAPSNLINLEVTKVVGKERTPFLKIQKFFLLAIGLSVFSLFLPLFSERTKSYSLFDFVIIFSSDIEILQILILYLILLLAIIYLTFRAPHRIITRIVLTFIFMLSQNLLFYFPFVLFTVFLRKGIDIEDISFFIGSVAPIAAFLIALMEFISLKLKKRADNGRIGTEKVKIEQYPTKVTKKDTEKQKDIEDIEKTRMLLEKLDEQLALGEITEAQYNRLSEKYISEAENLV